MVGWLPKMLDRFILVPDYLELAGKPALGLRLYMVLILPVTL